MASAGVAGSVYKPTELELKRVGLYFIDHTIGYEIVVNGPSGASEPPLLPNSLPNPPDPRGDPIPIHGIGLTTCGQ